MKISTFKCLIVFFFLCSAATVIAQAEKSSETAKKYPDTFTLNKKDVEGLLSAKINSKVSKKAGKYLAGSEVLANTASGDMKFLRLHLKYFENAFLNIQKNGNTSLQVFILSTDKSVFYKATMEGKKLIMTKCQEDDIISE